MMVNKTAVFVILILMAGFFSSCKEEVCFEPDYGVQMLEPYSLTFEAGANITAFIYKDSSGQEHRYDSTWNLDLKSPHLHPDTCDGNLIFVTHTPEHHIRIFTSPNKTSLAYAQIVDFLDNEQNLAEDRLADILKLSVFDDSAPGTVLSRICIMTSVRNGSLDQEEYNSPQFIEHDSLVILNKPFYNVLEQKQGAVKMYYTRTEGIVSFTDNSGVRLVLERTE